VCSVGRGGLVCCGRSVIIERVHCGDVHIAAVVAGPLDVVSDLWPFPGGGFRVTVSCIILHLCCVAARGWAPGPVVFCGGVVLPDLFSTTAISP